MKKKIKVLRTIESFYPIMSGPANQAFNISKGLEENGIRSPILTSDIGAEKRKKHEKIKGVEVYRFPVKWKFMKYFYTPEMKIAFEERFKDCDVVHCHSFRSYQTELAYKMAKKHGMKFVLHNHGSVMGYRTFVKGWRRLPYWIYDLFHSEIAKKADAVIVNSKQEYDEVVEYGVSKDKIYLIPVGIDASKYKPKKKIWAKKELRLLFVGRICRDRNIAPAIKAVRKLVDEGMNVKFRIVGGAVKRSDTEKGDYMAELMNLVKKLGLQKHVEFTGAIYGNELIEYYRTSDIFVYTSEWENFGQTILEAAAAGLPLICTKVGVALDLIEKGKTGWFVGKNDVKGIVKGVEVLSKKRGIDKRLREKVEKEYRWENIVDKYLKLYKKSRKPISYHQGIADTTSQT